MYFNKIDNPSNFSFIQTRKNPYGLGKRAFDFKLRDLGSDVHRVEVRSRAWKGSSSQAELDLRAFSGSKSSTTLRLDGCAELVLSRAKAGDELFRSRKEQSFGVSGTKWMFRFRHAPEMRFYGMGEKNNGFEKSGKRTLFWNTDVAGDFSPREVKEGVTDPMYASIPYLLVKLEEGWLGLLVNNPFPVFMNTGALEGLVQEPAESVLDRDFYVGSTDGAPELYLIYGATVDSVTCRLQKLCGTTPLPPLWALGHHQSRWGYRSYADLAALSEEFAARRIPNDGLWLDIDYMERYQVFTIDPEAFPEPEKNIADLRARGAHVVPILDPGIKLDKRFAHYRDGSQRELFCLNTENREYVGYVWPGAVVFPDFSMIEGRGWWAERVRALRAFGFDGFWLDMNDPSTGSVVLDEMRFDRGRRSHESFHNQYALGMQMASREGLLSAAPDKRPFLLSRSGFIGTSRYAALWTGDNVSNFHHLAGSIPLSLNLSLSGIPFNGPDVPGFDGDASDEVAIAWYKAAFLFPFLRNHCWKGGRRQEPWAFGAKVEKVLRHYIALRYKLLPYLYGLFIEQEESGRPILRPLFYEFEDPVLETIDDQFMVGPAIMQAPVVTANRNNRKVALPDSRWYSPWDRKWLRGGRQVTAVESSKNTPIYLREGSIVPMQAGERATNANALDDVELHLFVSEKYEGVAHYTYHFDDGESLAYRQGARSSIQFTVSRELRSVLVDVKPLSLGAGPCRIRFFLYDFFGSLIVRMGEKDDDMTVLALKSEPWTFAGTKVIPLATESIDVG